MNTLRLLTALLVATSLHSSFAETPVNEKDPKLSKAVNSVYPAIVRIEVVSEKGSGGRMMKSRSTGSGVIISRDGLVVTNHHVAGKATRITCRLYDGEELSADLLGADPMTDLAVIQLRIKNRPNNKPTLSVATFGGLGQGKSRRSMFRNGKPGRAFPVRYPRYHFQRSHDLAHVRILQARWGKRRRARTLAGA